MNTYQFFQVDAFTTVPLKGNPCAILFDSIEIDTQTKLKIAAEMNLSETVFVGDSTMADFKVQFFTQVEELPLAGHPTIATAHALVESGRVQLNSPSVTITFELPVGVISIGIENDGERVSSIRMNQLTPQFGRVYAPEDVLPLFSLQENDLLTAAKIQTVSTGTPQLMISLKDIQSVKRARFKVEEYIQFKRSGDFFSPHLFCLEGATSDGDTFARHFFPPPDVIEDPYTGSGNGGMAAYLWKYRLIEKPKIRAEQGHFLGRPGIGTVDIVGEPDAIERVEISGNAVTVIRGEVVL